MHTYPHLHIINMTKLIKGAICVLMTQQPVDSPLQNMFVHKDDASCLVKHSQNKSRQPETGKWAKRSKP